MTSAELRQNFLQKIAEFEQAIANNEADKVNGFDKELKEIESEFRAQLQAEIFGDCAKEENPLLALAMRHSFDSVSHKLIREDDVVVGVEAIFDKKVALDAVKFCKKQKLPLVWAKKCEKLAFYLCLDLAAKLNAPAEEVEKIRSKYKFTLDGAKGQDLGKDPISKTQFCKTLQGIVDDLLYLIDEVSGQKTNRIRIINADVEFVKAYFTRGGNEATLTINTVTSNKVAKAVFAAVHRILTNKSYSVSFKTERDAKSADAGKAEVSASAPTKGSEPKPKSGKKPRKSKTEPETITVPAPTAASEVSASAPVETELPSLDEMKGAEAQ